MQKDRKAYGKQVRYPKVLTIAGSDSSGGAGIQADIKTISALGCYGMSAITALTVQNTLGVTAIHNIPTDIVRGQIDAVVDDLGVDAVKIGMLHSQEIIQEVSQAVVSKGLPFVVHDPVMVSASGAKLIDAGAQSTLVKVLIPQTLLITPNVDEAALLLGQEINTPKDLTLAAKSLLKLGSQAVLLKGAHLVQNNVLDVLVMRHPTTGAAELYELETPRVATHNLHGAGCTLSAAIAAYLAQGLDLLDAVQAARVYVKAAIEAGAAVQTGRGVGPLNHGYSPLAMLLKEE